MNLSRFDQKYLLSALWSHWFILIKKYSLRLIIIELSSLSIQYIPLCIYDIGECTILNRKILW